MENNNGGIEENIGYTFKDKNLLSCALTHSSYAHELMISGEGAHDNERLEFLGDAVLELTTSEFLFNTYRQMPEGAMSKLRASLVSEQPLADSARGIKLHDYVKVGKGERMSGGNEKDSILSDAFEALLGAVYLDGGIEEARRLVHDTVLNDIEHKRRFYDAKTELQGFVQNKFQNVPEYKIVNEEGPAHDKKFTVECVVNGKTMAVGEGRSKKAAQQMAAFKTLAAFEAENEGT